ncbi:MAG: ECF transporter S component, partial [Firmicutes bacterium]|nr:ECF transporter S component [Bacillota bacterium]
MNTIITAIRTHIRTLTLSAMFLAMALLLPFLTGQIPQIGSLISPMHIPAFLCGMTCGPVWGLVVGAVSPLLRSLIFTMPPMAMAPMMAVELAAYGAVSGLLTRILPKGNLWLYANLAVS